MVNVYVLNYSENTYQKERVKKAVKNLGGEIINEFSQRLPCFFNKKLLARRLHIPNNDLDLMRSAEEIWVISGNKSFFESYKSGGLLAERSRTPIRYFSICHYGKYQNQIKEVRRSYLEDKRHENWN